MEVSAILSLMGGMMLIGLVTLSNEQLINSGVEKSLEKSLVYQVHDIIFL